MRVITPRPGTGVRFSINRYHQTWHVLSGLRGAQLLAHLLWGLAYQRVPGTLVVIGAPWLNPEPFGAGRSDPVAVVPAMLTALGPQAARQLRQRHAHPDRDGAGAEELGGRRRPARRLAP
jgi:hypothetical protein